MDGMAGANGGLTGNRDVWLDVWGGSSKEKKRKKEKRKHREEWKEHRRKEKRQRTSETGSGDAIMFQDSGTKEVHGVPNVLVTQYQP